MHKLVYLPIARQDLKEIIGYVSDTLKAPKAAMDLLDAFAKSIAYLKEFPYSCKVYQPLKPLLIEYRALQVKNYLVFYTVTEDSVEIHRIIYAKMNLEGIALN